MLLAVDIGNTNIVLGFLDGDRKEQMRGTYRITTKANHTSDEYGLMITEFLAMSGYSPSDVQDVIIVSVVPKVMHSFRASIVKFLGIDPMIVGPGIKTGINIRYENPRELGSDRIANAANLSALVYQALPDLNWVGFYFYDGTELVVGPFQGLPACVRIPLDKGVCGAAARTRQQVHRTDAHRSERA